MPFITDFLVFMVTHVPRTPCPVFLPAAAAAATVEADKEPEKGQPDVVGLKGAKEMSEMATRSKLLF